jgi:hypothetical protein
MSPTLIPVTVSIGIIFALMVHFNSGPANTLPVLD